MIVVIQCASRKRAGAGHLRAPSGKPVYFVADPQAAPANDDIIYARPDDQSGYDATWRDILQDYNSHPGANPLGLHSACSLYENSTYERLASRFGLANVYILSAGWGLIRGDFLKPVYDITFSPAADSYKRRRKTDIYADFRMLPDDTTDDIVFFGSKDYLPLFGRLTDAIRGPKLVFYNSANAPHLPGCTLRRFETTTRTNWHYECVNSFISGPVLGMR